jgi:hypothetical protein
MNTNFENDEAQMTHDESMTKGGDSVTAAALLHSLYAG